MADLGKPDYGFGEFRVDTNRRLLLRGGEPMPVTSKVFEALLVLIENRGQVVEKEVLLSRLWPDTVVEERNLAVSISTLRKVLGETAQDHRYIVTSSGRGYSFVAPVQELPQTSTAVVHDRVTATIEIEEESDKPRRWRLVTAVAASILLAATLGWWTLWPASQMQSVAVLPFKPLADAPGDPILLVGIADALIARLGRLNRIVVRPLGSVRRYGKQDQDPLAAGRELKVDSVLDGSIQQSGGKIRVTAQLYSVRSGKTEWTGEFDSEAGDPFAIQAAMAVQMARALSLRLSGREQALLARHDTDNHEAYLAYLQGRYSAGLLTRAGLLQAMDHYRRAITLDPNYAMAYAGLADALNLFGGYGAPNEYMPQAESAARRALELDEGVAGAHSTIGMVLYRYRYDWKGAGREFRRELDLNPNDPSTHHKYGWYLAMQGRTEEARRELEQAVQLAPNILMYRTDRLLPYYAGRQPEKTEAPLRRIIEDSPKYVTAYVDLALALMAQHRWREAIDTLQQGSPLDDDLEFLSALGVSYARLGERAEAQKYLDRLRDLATRRYVSPASLAMVYLAMGDRKEAMEYLQRGYEDHSWWMIFVKVDSRFDDLRSGLEFRELVKRVGLE